MTCTCTETAYQPLTPAEAKVFARYGFRTDNIEYIRDGYWKEDCDTATERKIKDELRIAFNYS